MPFLTNLLDPAILFFAFGILAGLLKSDLEVPPAIARFLSLYLLMSVGLKGGHALAASGVSADMLRVLAAALLLAVLVPALGYLLLHRLVSRFDAAALAATYGSVSATTFIAASQYLAQNDVAVGGHMAVALVLMESPAILMAMGLAAWVRRHEGAGSGAAHAAVQAPSAAHVLREAFTNGSHMLLMGGLLVGALSGEQGKAMMQPFAGDLFKGMLAFFLLDMGLLVARQLPLLKGTPRLLLAYAIGGPLVHAVLAIALARALQLSQGDATLLTVLAASSSYIVVPAVLRQAIPEAKPALYLGLSLAVTFVFNIVVGIPLYALAVQRLWVP